MRAVYTIMNRYRRFRLRTYIVSVVRAFADVRRMHDLGKGVPWPVPPAVLKTFAGRLKKMHLQWRARVIVSRMPEHLKAAFPQKCAAFEALNGRRIDWGYARQWRGDYLARPAEHDKSASQLPLYKAAVAAYGTCLFSANTLKINHWGKCEQRCVFINKTHVYKLVPGTFKQMKQTLALDELVGVTVSDGGDQMVILHSRAHNDMCVYLTQGGEDRVGELVGTLAAHCYA